MAKGRKATTSVSDTTVAETQNEKVVNSNQAGLPKVLFIRKIDKLSKFSKFGRPKFFGQERYRPGSESGNDVPLEFNGSTIPGSKRNLTPQWDGLNRAWAWKGTFSDLSRIAGALRLRDDEQKIIEPDQYSFSNQSDPFFNHPSLWYNEEKQIIEGNITLKTDVPLDEFYSRCYLGNPSIQDSTKVQSKAMLAGAELEVWSPKAETKAKKSGVMKDDKAIVLLSNMSVEKQRIIAQIIRPSGFDPKTEDVDLLYVELRESAALNTAVAAKFGNKTWQDRFIELADVSDEELYIVARIIDAKYKGALMKKKGTFHFMDKALYGEGQMAIADDIDLIHYFRAPDNDPLFQELIEWLDNNLK